MTEESSLEEKSDQYSYLYNSQNAEPKPPTQDSYSVSQAEEMPMHKSLAALDLQF